MSSSHGPPVIPPEVAVNQRRGQAVEIWAVGMFCVFCWEWLLCLPTEIKRIWRQKITSISALYLVNRYFGLLQFSIVISLVSGAWKPSTCKHGYLWEPVGALISTVLSQLILGARVFALFSRNRPIGILLSIILLVEVCVGGYSISTVTMPRAVPGVPIPCGAVTGPLGWLIAFWSIPLLFDTITFILTAWRAYDLWRKEVNTPLLNVIWRDGVLYFFAIFSMNFANVVIFLMTPKSLRAVNLTPTLMLTVVLSCRLVLNLRSTHAREGAWSVGYASSNSARFQSNAPSSTAHSPGQSLSTVRTLPRSPPAEMKSRHAEWIDISPPPLPKLEPNRLVPGHVYWQGDSTSLIA